MLNVSWTLAEMLEMRESKDEHICLLLFWCEVIIFSSFDSHVAH